MMRSTAKQFYQRYFSATQDACMKRSTIHQFYQRYFAATKNVSWLARQATAQRLEVLNSLMQWEVTKSASEH